MDKRTEKTKQRIHNAFLSLAPEGSDVFRISVMEIAKEAGISRSTFYSHYTDITDLMKEIADELTQSLLASLRTLLDEGGSSRELYLRCLRYVKNCRPVEAELLLSYGPFSLADTLAGYIPADTPDVKRATALFLATGQGGLLLDWKRSGCRTDINAMADLMEASLDNCGHLSH